MLREHSCGFAGTFSCFGNTPEAPLGVFSTFGSVPEASPAHFGLSGVRLNLSPWQFPRTAQKSYKGISIRRV